MSNLPCIMIAKAAAKDDVNLVLEAQGRGPGNLSRKMCAIDPGATWETPATHYMMQDMSATDTLVAEWQALCNGDLPAIPGQWGQDGVISSLDAQTACSGGNMQVLFGCRPGHWRGCHRLARWDVRRRWPAVRARPASVNFSLQE